MTTAMAEKGLKMANVNVVAQAIIKGIRRSSPIVYAPAKWAVIMMVIRHLPRLIFNKMDI
jgi:short-subunit dehydrogenase